MSREMDKVDEDALMLHCTLVDAGLDPLRNALRPAMGSLYDVDVVNFVAVMVGNQKTMAYIDQEMQDLDYNMEVWHKMKQVIVSYCIQFNREHAATGQDAPPPQEKSEVPPPTSSPPPQQQQQPKKKQPESSSAATSAGSSKRSIAAVSPAATGTAGDNPLALLGALSAPRGPAVGDKNKKNDTRQKRAFDRLTATKDGGGTPAHNSNIKHQPAPRGGGGRNNNNNNNEANHTPGGANRRGGQREKEFIRAPSGDRHRRDNDGHRGGGGGRGGPGRGDGPGRGGGDRRGGGRGDGRGGGDHHRGGRGGGGSGGGDRHRGGGDGLPPLHHNRGGNIGGGRDDRHGDSREFFGGGPRGTANPGGQRDFGGRRDEPGPFRDDRGGRNGPPRRHSSDHDMDQSNGRGGDRHGRGGRDMVRGTPESGQRGGGRHRDHGSGRSAEGGRYSGGGRFFDGGRGNNDRRSFDGAGSGGRGGRSPFDGGRIGGRGGAGPSDAGQGGGGGGEPAFDGGAGDGGGGYEEQWPQQEGPYNKRPRYEEEWGPSRGGGRGRGYRGHPSPLVAARAGRGRGRHFPDYNEVKTKMASMQWVAGGSASKLEETTNTTSEPKTD